MTMKPTAYFPLLLLFLLSFSITSHAEGNCPPGYYAIGATGQPGPQGCAPIPGYNQGQESVPTQSAPRWADRWGAIAYDTAGTNVGLGVATNMSSKDLAEQVALKECRAKGGAGCEVDLAYYNQCAVVIAGDHYVQSRGAATIQEASSNGLKECRESGASGCVVYYSACSLPERIQ